MGSGAGFRGRRISQTNAVITATKPTTTLTATIQGRLDISDVPDDTDQSRNEVLLQGANCNGCFPMRDG